MVTVLIADAIHPNFDLDIPCRIFPDMLTGRRVCAEIFGGEATKILSDGTNIWDIRPEKGSEIAKKLFTSHYFRDRRPGPFTLKEVPFDTAFIPFDLD